MGEVPLNYAILCNSSKNSHTRIHFQGDVVLKVSAFDGDYANPRRLRYGLDPTGLPYSSYFEIDPDAGVVKVRKSLQDIESRPNNPVILRVVAEELTDEDYERGITRGKKSGRKEQDASELRAEVEVAVVIDDVINRRPKFLQKQ
jgi:hypothetical protein